MAETDVAALSGLVTKREATLLTTWLRTQVDAGSLRSGQIKENELTDQSQRFLHEFVNALKSGQVNDITGPAWNAARDLLGEISRSRASRFHAHGNSDLRFLDEGAAVYAVAR